MMQHHDSSLTMEHPIMLAPGSAADSDSRVCASDYTLGSIAGVLVD